MISDLTVTLFSPFYLLHFSLNEEHYLLYKLYMTFTNLLTLGIQNDYLKVVLSFANFLANKCQIFCQ